MGKRIAQGDVAQDALSMLWPVAVASRPSAMLSDVIAPRKIILGLLS